MNSAITLLKGPFFFLYFRFQTILSSFPKPPQTSKRKSPRHTPESSQWNQQQVGIHTPKLQLHGQKPICPCCYLIYAHLEQNLGVPWVPQFLCGSPEPGLHHFHSRCVGRRFICVWTFDPLLKKKKKNQRGKLQPNCNHFCCHYRV